MLPNSHNKLVQFSITEQVARLIITRPEVLNALNHAVLLELQECLSQLQNNNNVTVVTIEGAGEKAFVAGADIKEMQNLSPVQARLFSELGQQIFSQLENLPQIVIAKVQGFALGGGLELALACDLIFAASKAKFGLPEVSLGLIPGFGGTQRLAKRLGASKALEWTISANKYSAEEAMAAGLINRITSPEELNSQTDTFINCVLKNAPNAIKAVKKSLKSGIGQPLSVGLSIEALEFGLRFSHPESTEGIEAFVEKRMPLW